MSDFYNPAITRKAAKEHRCTYCGEVIQKGNWGGRWFETKTHPECFEDMANSSEIEYTNERARSEA